MLAAEAQARFWAALSALRGGRIVHPVGDVFTATLAVPARRTPTGVPLFDEPRTRPALVRISRALGLARPLPDPLGLALRLPDAHGEGLHQDFLLITSADGPLLHHLILPPLREHQTYSSILPYRVGGALRLVGARPVGTSPRQFDLAIAPLAGRWSAVARLELRRRLAPDASERVGFNPWNTGGGIVPAGPFQRARGPAYRGSQRARRLG
jgi:hypothetical protein